MYIPVSHLFVNVPYYKEILHVIQSNLFIFYDFGICLKKFSQPQVQKGIFLQSCLFAL